MPRIVVIGSLNMDLVAVTAHLPLPGQTVTGAEFLSEHGGKGANQAYAAARLGGDVAMLGRIGSDEHGRRMHAGLAEAGCDVSGVRFTEGASGVALIFVSGSGQNSIVVVPGANHRYMPADLQNDECRLSHSQWVLLQLESPMETVIAAAQAARRQGARVMLDPAPAPAALPTELLRHVDVLTPNESETAQLTGRPLGELSEDAAREAARQLQATGVGAVIIKMGARGCVLAEGEHMTSIAAPRVTAVDTTAAGDVFNGALAVACSEGAPLPQACRFAVRAAALSVTRFGAQRSMPSRKELNGFEGS